MRSAGSNAAALAALAALAVLVAGLQAHAIGKWPLSHQPSQSSPEVLQLLRKTGSAFKQVGDILLRKTGSSATSSAPTSTHGLVGYGSGHVSGYGPAYGPAYAPHHRGVYGVYAPPHPFHYYYPVPQSVPQVYPPVHYLPGHHVQYPDSAGSVGSAGHGFPAGLSEHLSSLASEYEAAARNECGCGNIEVNMRPSGKDSDIVVEVTLGDVTQEDADEYGAESRSKTVNLFNVSEASEGGEVGEEACGRASSSASIEEKTVEDSDDTHTIQVVEAMKLRPETSVLQVETYDNTVAAVEKTIQKTVTIKSETEEKKTIDNSDGQTIINVKTYEETFPKPADCDKEISQGGYEDEVVEQGNYGQSSQGNYGTQHSSQDNYGTQHSSQGNYGQSSQGNYGQSSQGSYGQSSQGSHGQSSQGNYGQSSQDNYGTQHSSQGNYGQSSQGSYGQSSQGSHGQSSQGNYGQSSQGNYGTQHSSQGECGTQQPQTAYGNYGSKQSQSTQEYQQKVEVVEVQKQKLEELKKEAGVVSEIVETIDIEEDENEDCDCSKPEAQYPVAQKQRGIDIKVVDVGSDQQCDKTATGDAQYVEYEYEYENEDEEVQNDCLDKDVKDLKQYYPSTATAPKYAAPTKSDSCQAGEHVLAEHPHPVENVQIVAKGTSGEAYAEGLKTHTDSNSAFQYQSHGTSHHHQPRPAPHHEVPCEAHYGLPRRQQQTYSATQQQSYSAPQQQSYSAPQQQKIYSAPQQTYSAPQQQKSYSAPQQQSYSAPQQQKIYSNPQQQSYSAPQQQRSYSAPQQQSYSAPQQQKIYSNPQQQSYSAPQQQKSYSAPQQQSYSAPQQQKSYSAPQQQKIYSAPQQQSYSTPQQQKSYSAPQQQSYSVPQQQKSYSVSRQQSHSTPQQQSYSAHQQQKTYSAPQQQSYSAPQQQSYSTPQQQSFSTPPQQKIYSAPQQQSYAAPKQQSYSAPKQQQSYSSTEQKSYFISQQPKPEQQSHSVQGGNQFHQPSSPAVLPAHAHPQSASATWGSSEKQQLYPQSQSYYQPQATTYSQQPESAGYSAPAGQQSASYSSTSKQTTTTVTKQLGAPDVLGAYDNSAIKSGKISPAQYPPYYFSSHKDSVYAPALISSQKPHPLPAVSTYKAPAAVQGPHTYSVPAIDSDEVVPERYASQVNYNTPVVSKAVQSYAESGEDSSELLPAVYGKPSVAKTAASASTQGYSALSGQAARGVSSASYSAPSKIAVKIAPESYSGPVAVRKPAIASVDSAYRYSVPVGDSAEVGSYSSKPTLTRVAATPVQSYSAPVEDSIEIYGAGPALHSKSAGAASYTSEGSSAYDNEEGPIKFGLLSGGGAARAASIDLPYGGSSYVKSVGRPVEAVAAVGEAGPADGDVLVASIESPSDNAWATGLASGLPSGKSAWKSGAVPLLVKEIE